MKFTFGMFLLGFFVIMTIYIFGNSIHEQRAKICKDVWNVELISRKNSRGGVAFEHETVKDFCQSEGLTPETKIRVLNKALKDCGIQPVRFKDIEEEDIDW